MRKTKHLHIQVDECAAKSRKMLETIQHAIAPIDNLNVDPVLGLGFQLNYMVASSKDDISEVKYAPYFEVETKPPNNSGCGCCCGSRK